MQPPAAPSRAGGASRGGIGQGQGQAEPIPLLAGPDVLQGPGRRTVCQLPGPSAPRLCVPQRPRNRRSACGPLADRASGGATSPRLQHPPAIPPPVLLSWRAHRLAAARLALALGIFPAGTASRHGRRARTAARTAASRSFTRLSRGSCRLRGRLAKIHRCRRGARSGPHLPIARAALASAYARPARRTPASPPWDGMFGTPRRAGEGLPRRHHPFHARPGATFPSPSALASMAASSTRPGSPVRRVGRRDAGTWALQLLLLHRRSRAPSPRRDGHAGSGGPPLRLRQGWRSTSENRNLRPRSRLQPKWLSDHFPGPEPSPSRAGGTIAG